MSDEERIEQLELENKVLKENNKGLKDKIDELQKDISNMYDKEVVISIICDEFNVTRLEVLEMLGEDE